MTTPHHLSMQRTVARPSAIPKRHTAPAPVAAFGPGSDMDLTSVPTRSIGLIQRSTGMSEPCPGENRDRPSARPLFAEAGNRAEHRRMQEASSSPMPVPTRVAPTSDPSERDADTIADRIAGQQPPSVQSPVPTTAGLSTSLGLGRPLEASTRFRFEAELGADLSAARIHTDARSGDAADGLQAAAYTVGSHIVFGRDSYAPNTAGGNWLLAHELAHVSQNAHNPNATTAHRAPTNPVIGSPAGVAQAGGERPPLLVQAEIKSIADEAAGWAQLRQPSRSSYGAIGIVTEGGGFEGVATYDRTSGQVVLKVHEIGQELKGTRSYNIGLLSRAQLSNLQIESGGNVVKFGNLVEPLIRTLISDATGQPAFDPGKSASKTGVDWRPLQPPLPFGSGADPAAPNAAPKSEGSVVEVKPAAPQPGAVPDVIPGGASAKGLAPEVVAPESPAGVAPEASAVPDAPGAGGALAKLSIPKVALGIAIEAIVAIAVSLLVDWFKQLIDKGAVERDLKALRPKIQAELAKLAPKIATLQSQGKVFARITLQTHRSHSETAASPMPGVIVGDFYRGTSIVNVDVSGETLPTSSSETTDGPPNNLDTHRTWAYSALLDDPAKRAREEQQGEITKRLQQIAKDDPHPPPTPPAQGAPSSTPLLQPPGVSAPQTFTPLPGAPPPSVDPMSYVQASRAQMARLLARGERLVGATPSPARTELDAFDKQESTWRLLATYLYNHFKDEGPDTARASMDEILNEDHQGGRLKVIRHNLAL
jgi:hypothetical protein